MSDTLSKVLSMEEWRKQLRPRKAQADFHLLNRLIEGQEKFDFGTADAHMTHEMALWHGMAPTPPFDINDILVADGDEIEFPPIAPLLPSA